MFYSIAFAGEASGDAPLKACWQISHGRKLKKNQLLEFSIPGAAKLISKPSVALSLRCAFFSPQSCPNCMNRSSAPSPSVHPGSARQPSARGLCTYCISSAIHILTSSFSFSYHVLLFCFTESEQAKLDCSTQAYLAKGLVIILKLKTGFLLDDVQTIRSKLEQWDAQHKADKAAKRSSKKKKSRKTDNGIDALYRPQCAMNLFLRLD